MIVVAGENVVDLLSRPDGALFPALGGGPANIAIAAARLGAEVAMVARLGSDPFGQRFADRLGAAGVKTMHLVRAAEPSTLALASIGADGGAGFTFWLSGAADFGWQDAELPLLASTDVLHLGSLAAFVMPGADALERWAATHQGPVTFDPNLRPVVLADRKTAVARLERLVGLATVVKVSEDDLALAYPDTPPVQTARRWAGERGSKLVVVTLGGRGVVAYSESGELSQPAPQVSIVDTIGAGDTAMGALLVALHRGELGDLPRVLKYVCAAAALACTQSGAQPPTAAEVDVLLDSMA